MLMPKRCPGIFWGRLLAVTGQNHATVTGRDGPSLCLCLGTVQFTNLLIATVEVRQKGQKPCALANTQCLGRVYFL